MITHIHHRIRRHTISFHYAFEGLCWVLKTQPNYLIHLFLSLLCILAGLYLGIKKFEWLIIMLTIGGGLAIETMNSAIEQTLDCVSSSHRDDIKIAKDVAAAGMLIYACAAAIIGLSIFIPYLFPL
ncbi:MAG: diacylglycerol kinase family protein [Candidatus Roizmanbacteria bacterium]